MLALKLRPAASSDARKLYNWRRDPTTAANSLRPPPATYEQHTIWLSRILHDETKTLILAETTHKRPTSIGMVRFDRGTNGKAEISVTIAPNQRGKGYGRKLIRNAARLYTQQRGTDSVWACVRADNQASLHAFMNAGFELRDIDTSEGHVPCRLRLCILEYRST